MQRRHLLLLPVLLLAVLVTLTVVAAHAANISVPAGSLALASQAAAAAQFEPAACTGTVNDIVFVSGAGLFNVSTANHLIIGTSGNDNVKAQAGYNCFVGGGPVNNNKDKFNGPAGGGAQCIVAASDPAANIANCSIVQRSP